MQFVKWTWGIKEHDPCQERMVQMTAVKELFWQRLQLQCYDDNQEEEARLLTLVYRSSSKTLFLCSSGQMEEISLIMEKEIWEPSDVGDNASSLRSNTDVEVELVQLWQGGCGTKEGGWEVCLFGESFWISVQTQFLCAGWLKASWNLNQTTAFRCVWCLTCQEGDPMRSMALTDKETCIRMQGKVFSSSMCSTTCMHDDGLITAVPIIRQPMQHYSSRFFPRQSASIPWSTLRKLSSSASTSWRRNTRGWSSSAAVKQRRMPW